MALLYEIPELPAEFSRPGPDFPAHLMENIPEGLYYDPLREELVYKERGIHWPVYLSVSVLAFKVSNPSFTLPAVRAEKVGREGSGCFSLADVLDILNAAHGK